MLSWTLYFLHFVAPLGSLPPQAHRQLPMLSLPLGSAASEALRVIRERATQSTRSAPAWGNEGESAHPLSPFSFAGGDLSWDLSNDGGFREEEEMSSFQGVASRRLAFETEGLMHLETNNPVVGLENQMALDSLGCFGALASSRAAGPPSAGPCNQRSSYDRF